MSSNSCFVGAAAIVIAVLRATSRSSPVTQIDPAYAIGAGAILIAAGFALRVAAATGKRLKREVSASRSSLRDQSVRTILPTWPPASSR